MKVKSVFKVAHRHRVEAVDGAGFSDLWEKFEEYLLSRDMSEDTLETYKRTVYEYLYRASEAPFDKQSARSAFFTEGFKRT